MVTATAAWRQLLAADLTVRACCELPTDDPLRLQAERSRRRAWDQLAWVLMRTN